MTTTLQRTQRLIARRLEIDERELDPGRTLASLGIDSLATLELLFDLENEFGFRIDQSDPRITTLDELVRFVDREVARQCAAAA